MESGAKGIDLLRSRGVEIAAACTEFRVSELSVFGSALRDNFSSESDFDLLVSFRPDATVGLFHLIRLQHRLEDLLGRRVDLVPKEGLKPLIRDDILSAARVIYAA